MCRMLVFRAPTIKESQEVLGGFREQASQSRGDPEDGKRRHPDGWGLVAFAPGIVRYVARRPEDAATDSYFERAQELMKNSPKGAAYLAHFRRSSTGGKAMENTHPFLADGWAFAHNGTVEGLTQDPGVTYQGQTDSEHLFRKLLKHMRVQPNFDQALRRTVYEIESNGGRYTSLTFLMTDGNTVYGYVRTGPDFKGKRTPEQMRAYYALGWGQRGKTTMIAQETTGLGQFESWTPVPEDHVLVWKPPAKPEIHSLGLVEAASAAQA